MKRISRAGIGAVVVLSGCGNDDDTSSSTTEATVEATDDTSTATDSGTGGMTVEDVAVVAPLEGDDFAVVTITAGTSE